MNNLFVGRSSPKYIVTAFVLLMSALSYCLAQGTVTPKKIGPNWVVNCTNSGNQSVMSCRMTQTLVMRKTGQKLLSITVRKAPKAKNAAIMITLPHGLFLPAGIRLVVDNGKPAKHPVQTCDRAGCYIGLPMKDALLIKLLKGKQLSISFQNLKRKTIRVPATLAGFATSWGKMK